MVAVGAGELTSAVALLAAENPVSRRDKRYTRRNYK
jgi:hypothetical protein